MAGHGDMGELMDQHRDVEREHECHRKDIRVGVGAIVEPLAEQVDQCRAHDQEGRPDQHVDADEASEAPGAGCWGELTESTYRSRGVIRFVGGRN